MKKQNCWEFKQCNRQPGGLLAGELGVCPASIDTTLNGAHGGENAGRACWAVVGTFCGGVIQGTEAQKKHNCWMCKFFQQVRNEESGSEAGFSATKLGMERSMRSLRIGLNAKTASL